MQAFNMWESNIVLFVQENLRFGFLNPIMKFITSLGDEGILPIAVIILFLLFSFGTGKNGICGTVNEKIQTHDHSQKEEGHDDQLADIVQAHVVDQYPVDGISDIRKYHKA